MGSKLQPLASILARAREQRFVMEDIPWEQKLDRQKLFIPEVITALYHTPYYEHFNDDERLSYNQYSAMAVTEQFCYLESDLLTNVFGGLLLRDKKKLDKDLVTAMKGFVEEEHKHIEIFRRLNRLSWPEVYSTTDYYFVRRSIVNTVINGLARRWPHLLMGWIWLTLALEEKTISVSREYESQGENARLPTDGLYRMVHKLHARDEARHVQIDQHILQYLYTGAPEWRKRFNQRLIARSLRTFTMPRLNSTRVRVLRETVKRHPRLKEWEHEMIAAIEGLNTNEEYQRRVWGRGALPITFHLLDAGQDMDIVRQVFPSYKKLDSG